MDEECSVRMSRGAGAVSPTTEKAGDEARVPDAFFVGMIWVTVMLVGLKMSAATVWIISGVSWSSVASRSAKSFQLPMETPRPNSFIMSVTDSKDRCQSSRIVFLMVLKVAVVTLCVAKL